MNMRASNREKRPEAEENRDFHDVLRNGPEKRKTVKERKMERKVTFHIFGQLFWERKRGKKRMARIVSAGTETVYNHNKERGVPSGRRRCAKDTTPPMEENRNVR